MSPRVAEDAASHCHYALRDSPHRHVVLICCNKASNRVNFDLLKRGYGDGSALRSKSILILGLLDRLIRIALPVQAHSARGRSRLRTRLLSQSATLR